MPYTTNSSAVRRCAGHRRPAPRLTVYRRVRVPQPAASRRRAKCRHATGLSGMSPRRAQRRAELRCATSRRFSGMASSQASRSPSLVSPATVALSCSRRGPTCKKQVASNQGDLWGSQQEDGWRDKLEGVCMACSPVIRAAVLSPGLPGHSISVPAPPAPAGGAQRGCRATSSSPPIQC